MELPLTGGVPLNTLMSVSPNVGVTSVFQRYFLSDRHIRIQCQIPVFVSVNPPPLFLVLPHEARVSYGPKIPRALSLKLLDSRFSILVSTRTESPVQSEFLQCSRNEGSETLGKKNKKKHPRRETQTHAKSI